jgi:predicted small lipoprotein YifL
MNRILLCLALTALAGCNSSQPLPPEDVVAQVGNYVITRQEFDEAYKNSSYGDQGTLASRQIFLNNMINQKIILLDAEKRGLDKNKEFLKMVESFWQQSLLTMAMQEKAREGGNLDAWVGYLKKNTTVEINQEALR